MGHSICRCIVRCFGMKQKMQTFTWKKGGKNKGSNLYINYTLVGFLKEFGLID